MQNDSALRPRALKKILVTTMDTRAYVVPKKNLVPDSSIAVWQRIALQLTPIIGANGFHALYCRSLYLTIPNFPWLSLAQDIHQANAPFVKLKHCLEQREDIDTGKAMYVLLQTFTELLATLIGASLTKRLLRSKRLCVSHVSLPDEA